MIEKSKKERSFDVEQVEHDIENLTRTALKEKYELTYQSWKNGKFRAKKRGCWAQEFDQFADFLRHMGPRPDREHTLDRIENDNPHYGPGLCDWRTSLDQNNNRRSTISLDQKGLRIPLSQIARESGQSPAALRRAFRSGAFDTTGWAVGEPSKDGSTFGRDPRLYRPWPYRNNPELRQRWEQAYLKDAKSGQNRFEFIFGRLERVVWKMRTKLDQNLFDPELKSDLDARASAGKAKKVLEELDRQYPRWITECRRFERLKSREANPLLDYQLWKARTEDDQD